MQHAQHTTSTNCCGKFAQKLIKFIKALGELRHRQKPAKLKYHVLAIKRSGVCAHFGLNWKTGEKKIKQTLKAGPDRKISRTFSPQP